VCASVNEECITVTCPKPFVSSIIRNS